VTGAAGTRYRADVDGLRAVAVTLVVVYHAGWHPFGGGFVGVDVFFVISGFLITGLLADELRRDGTVSLARFYGRRARRLLPLSTLVLAVTAVTFLLLLSPLYRGALAGDVRAAALYVGNWHFAAGALLYGTVSADSPVIHYWSLGVEEQFYLLWPLLLLVTAGALGRSGNCRDWPTTRRRMTIALSAVFAVSLALSVVLTPSSAPYAYYGLHTRAWELAAGGLLALAAGRRSPGSAVLAVIGWLGLAMIAVSAIVITTRTTFPGTAAAAPVAGAVAVLGSGIRAGPAGPARLLGSPPLAYVGRLSYAWYLWHWPCLVAAGTLAAELRDRDVNHGIVLPHGWVTIVAVAVSLGLSVVSHHLVEDPVRHSTRLRATRLRSLALGAALSAAAVVTSVVILPASNGAVSGPVLADIAVGAPPRIVARPVALRMSPGQASTDRPLGVRDCYDGYQDSTVAADCVFGDPQATRSIAVIGDSHAEQWFAALDQVARAQHLRLYLWAKEACPLINLSVRLPQFDQSYPWCTTWRAGVLQRLARLGTLDAVVVSHVGISRSDPGRYAAPGGAPLTAADIGTSWSTAWASTAAVLHRDARHVIVLRDIPRPATDIPGCLAVHGRDDVPCSFSHTEAFADSDVLLRAERSGDSRTAVLDVDDLLCPDSTCPVIWPDGTIIYRTNDHLTARMAQLLAPALGTRLHALLSAGRSHGVPRHR
jgi:peptidoglycan/LPS O-acetylase OafA/YrhL